jgi:hypothetical protein
MPFPPLLPPSRTPRSARQQRWEARQPQGVPKEGSSSEENEAVELEARQGAKGVPTSATTAVELPGTFKRAGSRGPSIRMSTWHGEGGEGSRDDVIAPAPRVRRSRAARRSRRQAHEAPDGYTPSVSGEGSRAGVGASLAQTSTTATQQSLDSVRRGWQAAPRELVADGPRASAGPVAMDVEADQSLAVEEESPSRQRVSSSGSGRRRQHRFGSDSESD